MDRLSRVGLTILALVWLTVGMADSVHAAIPAIERQALITASLNTLDLGDNQGAVYFEIQDLTVEQTMGDTPSPPLVGGECEYKQYEGAAEIISITPVPDSSEKYQVKFLFHSEEPVQEAFAAAEGKQYSLLMADSSNPDKGFIRTYGIEVGAQFDCLMKVITRGTCTPVLFEFPTLDLSTRSGK